MAIKTIYFFLFILTISLVSAFGINTESVSSKSKDDIPTIEFGVFEAYRIEKDGIKEALIADRGLHYKNRDILYKGYIFSKGEEGIRSLDGDKIILTKDKVSIFGNGHYIDPTGHEIYSDNAVYDIKKKFLAGKGKFTVKIEDNIINGKDLFIDGKSKIIKGSKIKAEIYTK
ncbi:MAG: hypothetical protein OIF32_11570 [Campylobacterales bacterium]|nr:hypothetical protein [Campylobacterales bacterium]